MTVVAGAGCVGVAAAVVAGVGGGGAVELVVLAVVVAGGGEAVVAVPAVVLSAVVVAPAGAVVGAALFESEPQPASVSASKRTTGGKATLTGSAGYSVSGERRRRSGTFHS